MHRIKKEWGAVVSIKLNQVSKRTEGMGKHLTVSTDRALRILCELSHLDNFLILCCLGCWKFVLVVMVGGWQGHYLMQTECQFESLWPSVGWTVLCYVQNWKLMLLALIKGIETLHCSCILYSLYIAHMKGIWIQLIPFTKEIGFHQGTWLSFFFFHFTWPLSETTTDDERQNLQWVHVSDVKMLKCASRVICSTSRHLALKVWSYCISLQHWALYLKENKNA